MLQITPPTLIPIIRVKTADKHPTQALNDRDFPENQIRIFCFFITINSKGIDKKLDSSVFG